MKSNLGTNLAMKQRIKSMKITHKDIIVLLGVIIALIITISFSYSETSQARHRNSPSQTIHAFSDRTSLQKPTPSLNLNSLIKFLVHR